MKTSKESHGHSSCIDLDYLEIGEWTLETG